MSPVKNLSVLFSFSDYPFQGILSTIGAAPSQNHADFDSTIVPMVQVLHIVF